MITSNDPAEPKSKTRREIKKGFIVLGTIVPVLIFGFWFGWKSYEVSKTQLVELKVKNALNQSMESLSVSLPRKQIVDGNSGAAFYAPDFNARFHSFDLYGQTLINLNQDSSVPIMKLFNVSVSEEYGSADTILYSQATVEFPLILGIDKEMIFRSSIRVPRFNSAN